MAVTVLGSLPSGITAPVSIVISTTGVTSYGTFTVEGAPNTRDHTLVLSATDPTALPTTLSVDIEASPDGGATWGKYATAIALVATSVLTLKPVLNVVAGLLYRINPTSFTAGSATSTVVRGTVN